MKRKPAWERILLPLLFLWAIPNRFLSLLRRLFGVTPKPSSGAQLPAPRLDFERVDTTTLRGMCMELLYYLERIYPSERVHVIDGCDGKARVLVKGSFAIYTPVQLKELVDQLRATGGNQ